MKGRRPGRRVGPYYSRPTGDNWLRDARVDARLTIAELAEKSRVSVRTIKRIESGDPNAGRNVAWKLRRALGLGF